MVTQVDLILQNWREYQVLVTISLNRLSICALVLWYHILHFYGILQFLISAWRFLGFCDNGWRRNLDKFYFFFIYSDTNNKCKIYRKYFLRSSLKGCPPWLIIVKIVVSRTSKMFVSSLREFIMFKEFNIGRKSTSSQWLILFREILYWTL